MSSNHLATGQWFDQHDAVRNGLLLGERRIDPPSDLRGGGLAIFDLDTCWTELMTGRWGMCPDLFSHAAPTG